MSRYDYLVHNYTPAPRGLVAHFVERIYVDEPSLVRAYEQDHEAWKQTMMARQIPGSIGISLTWEELGKRPRLKRLERFVTKELDVVAFGTFDLIEHEERYVRSNKSEVRRERLAGPLVTYPHSLMVPVWYLDRHDDNLVFLGMELEGKPFGQRYHLNARKDLGAKAPHGFTWMDNNGSLTQDTPVYRPTAELSKMPSLYPMGDCETPIEEGSRFLEDWEAEDADVDEYYYVKRRYQEKQDALAREQHERNHPGLPVILERYKKALDEGRDRQLAELKEKLELENKKEFDAMKAELEAKEKAAWEKASTQARSEREASETKSRNSKLD